MQVLRKMPASLHETPPQLPPWYYRLLIALLRPLYRVWLFTKQDKLPHYAREIAERFGTNYKRPKPIAGKPVIWCHAVSLGELNTAYPLLQQYLAEGYGLYVTTTTQTGFGRAGALFEHEVASGQVVYGFVPIDDLAVVYRFLVCVSPNIALFMETELWANTLFCLKRYAVPSVIVNARLVDKSFANYQRFKALSASMMNNVSLVIAQDTRTAKNFLALGLDEDKLVVADSLKWSQTAFTDVVTKRQHKRRTWLAASTHDGEELACLLAHKKLLADDPDALLIIVPRHPERFEAVYTLCAEQLRTGRYSEGVIKASMQVYVLDTMGELINFYHQCDVALVGGSLVDIGGHNPLEPASLAKPVIMGCYTQACEALLSALMAVGAAVQVGDSADILGLYNALHHWLFAPAEAKKAGQAGQALTLSKAQAVIQQKSHIDALLLSHANKRTLIDVDSDDE